MYQIKQPNQRPDSRKKKLYQKRQQREFEKQSLFNSMFSPIGEQLAQLNHNRMVDKGNEQGKII